MATSSHVPPEHQICHNMASHAERWSITSTRASSATCLVLSDVLAETGIFDRPVDKIPARVPVACSHVRDWHAVAGHMFDEGMLELLPPSSALSFHGRPPPNSLAS